MPGRERRKAKRFKYSTEAKFLLRGDCESVGRVLDVSEGGIALFTDAEAAEGDEIVVYPEGLGRLQGKVVRTFKGGVGIAFSHTDAQRKTIRKKITQALQGKPYMRLAELRSGVRKKYNLETVVSIDGSPQSIPCTIIDMSESGCLVKCEARPPVGAGVKLGMLKGRVSRFDDQGFAIEFQGGGAVAETAEDNAEPQAKAQQG